MTGGSPFVPGARSSAAFTLRDSTIEASEYGVVADLLSLTDVSTTASSTTVTSATGGLTQSDVGKAVSISKSVVVGSQVTDGAATGNTFTVTSATLSPQASWVGKAITITDGVVRLSSTIQVVSGSTVTVGRWGVRSLTDATLTSASAVITCPSGQFDATNDAGAQVTGTGIQSGSTISSVDSPTQITLNKTATQSRTGTITVTRVTAQTGLTVTVHDALSTTLAAVASDGFSATLADAPNVTSINATMRYFTDNSTAMQSAIDAASGKKLRLPLGPIGIVTGLTSNGTCIIEGQGMPVNTAMVGGTKLVYSGTGSALTINSTAPSNGVTDFLRDFGIDGVQAGAIGVTLGSSTGSGTKSAVGAFVNVNVSRFQTANWYLVSDAGLNFFGCYGQNSGGGSGVLADAVTSSAFNTSCNFYGCNFTGNRYGVYLKDARSLRFRDCEINSNNEEAVIIEKQTGSTFVIRNVVFEGCRFEGNIAGQGVANTGRWQVKCSELGTTAIETVSFRNCNFSLNPSQTSDKDLYLRGGTFTLWDNSWSAHSTGYGITAPNISTAVTSITEWTKDFLVSAVDSTQYSIGTGVVATLFRHNAGAWEEYHANGGSFVLTSSTSAAGVLSVTNTPIVKSGTALTAGGASGLSIGTSSAIGIYFGSGAPTVSAPKGSLYLRSDGSGTSDRIYVNTNGSTTWTAVTTAA